MSRSLLSLSYSPSEIDRMRPGVADIVIERGMRRPEGGVPEGWLEEEGGGVGKVESGKDDATPGIKGGRRGIGRFIKRVLTLRVVRRGGESGRVRTVDHTQQQQRQRGQRGQTTTQRPRPRRRRRFVLLAVGTTAAAFLTSTASKNLPIPTIISSFPTLLPSVPHNNFFVSDDDNDDDDEYERVGVATPRTTTTRTTRLRAIAGIKDGIVWVGRKAVTVVGGVVVGGGGGGGVLRRDTDRTREGSSDDEGGVVGYYKADKDDKNRRTITAKNDDDDDGIIPTFLTTTGTTPRTGGEGEEGETFLDWVIGVLMVKRGWVFGTGEV